MTDARKSRWELVLHPDGITASPLFATDTVTAPPDLVEELRTAGMIAASWQVEDLRRERDEVVAQLKDLEANLPSECKTGKDLADYIDEIERDAREEASEQARSELKAQFRSLAESFESLIKLGGRISRKDLEPLVEELCEAVL